MGFQREFVFPTSSARVGNSHRSGSGSLDAILTHSYVEFSIGIVRFVPKGDESKILLGEPADVSVDVGAAVRKGEDVVVNVYSGTSVLDAGSPTGETAVIGRILSPLAREEVGTIRCIGLNVSIRSACPGTRRDCCFLLQDGAKC